MPEYHETTTLKELFESDQPNVILSTMKQAEDADGIILRLYETNGKPTTVTVKVPFAPLPFHAYLTSTVEEDLTPLPSEPEERSFTLSMSPGMVATVRVTTR